MGYSPAGASGRLRLDLSRLDAERGVPGSEEFPTPGASLSDERLAAAALALRVVSGGVIAALDEQVRNTVEQLHEANVHNYLDLPDGVRISSLRRVN